MKERDRETERERERERERFGQHTTSAAILTQFNWCALCRLVIGFPILGLGSFDGVAAVIGAVECAPLFSSRAAS